MSFRIATAYVDVRANDDGLREDLQAKVRAAAESAAARVKVNADSDGLSEKVQAAADAAHAEAHVKVKVDENDFEAEFRRAMDEGDAAMARASADLRQSFSTLESASRTVRATMEDAGQGAENAGTKVENAGRKTESAGRSAASAGSGFRLASVGIGSTAAAATSLIPALAAVPGVAAAAAAGIATLASAFFGVGKALHDYGAAQDAAGGGGGGQTAATAYSNAVAIRGAEQAIADAREQAARSAQQSAEQVQNAQRGVEDAERQAATAARNAADQITAAQQRVTQAAYAGQQAEQAYTNAVYNEQQAQTALINARQAAADQLVDSQNAAKDAHLATEQAAANAASAQRALTAANSNDLLTLDQKQAADLAAQVAAQQLIDAKQHEKEAVEKATAATAAGVDQAPQVLSAQHAVEMAAQATAAAQHGVATAAQQQADAQAALAKANQAAADQQVSSAEQVAKAQQSLADAQRQADQQREDSAKAVQRAEQNLTDTLKEQQLAADAAGASGAAAANKFAKDYAALTPAGKAFVDQVLSMRGELHQLAADAQTATLPGFTQMLKDSEALLPTVEDGVKRTGRALSDMALGFAHLFANRQFQESALQFEQIITSGFGEFTSALPPLLNAIVTDGVQAAPLINAVAVGVHDLVSSGLPAFLSGLSTNAGGAAQGVSALFQGVDQLLGPVGTLAGALGGAVGPAVADLVPSLTAMATEVEKSLLPIMPQLGTDLKDVADVVDALLQVLTPVIPMIAQDLSDGLKAVDPLLRDMAHFLHDNEQWLEPIAKHLVIMVAAWKSFNLVATPAAKVIDSATSALGRLGGAAKGAGKEAETAGEAIGGARGLANKVGGAIPIVGTAITGFLAFGDWLHHVVYDGHEAAVSVDEFTTAMLNSENPTTNAVAGMSQYVQLSQAIGSNKRGVTDALAQTGLGMIELSHATFGTNQDLQNYDASLAQMVTSGNADRARDIVAQLSKATDAHGNAIVTVSKDLPGYQAALEKADADQQAATRSAANNGTAIDNLGQSIVTTKDKWQLMSDTMSNTEALDRFHADLLNLKQTVDDNGTSLDGNTAKGLANRQAFSNLADEIQAYGKRLHDSGDSNDDAAKHMRDMVNQLEDQGKKLGYSKGEIDDYIKHLGLIPESVETKINTEIQIQLDKQGLQAAVRAGFDVPKMAGGGEVVGPGTTTSDSALRWLSNREWVIPADAAAAIGPAGMEQIRQGRIPAVGGTTAQPAAPMINLNYYGTQGPSPEQWQVMQRDLALAVRG